MEGNPGNGLIDVCQYGARIASVISWCPPGNTGIAQRLDVEGGSIGANTARGILDWFALTPTQWQQYEVFARAIADRTLLQYSNRPEFWNDKFKTHCQIETAQAPQPRGRRRQNIQQPAQLPAPIEEILSQMLRAGFNWCAEPNWLGWAYDQIPNAMGWKKIGKKCKQQLWESLRAMCPPMLVQKSIEQGYPVCDLPDFGYIQPLLSPPSGMWCLLPIDTNLHYPTTGFPLSRPHNTPCFKKDGIALTNGARREAIFSYHNNNDINLGNASVTFRLVLSTNRETEFVEFMLDGRNLQDNGLISETERELLHQMFLSALNAAVDVVGRREDRGLYLMFDLAAQGFREWDDRSTRLVVFESAVLCRLHAWLGWQASPEDAAPQYPTEWPLNDPAKYDLVCRIVRNAWHDTATRDVLIKDLIPVEWMLAWFHA